MLARRLAVLCLLLATPSLAAWRPDGVDLTRPRLLFRADDLPVIHARLDRQPYVGLMQEVLRRIRNADSIALDDHAIAAERLKARAAKSLAFLYAIDRTVVDGEVVPFASPDERAAVGRRAHDLLLAMYDRSRLAVPPPLGGWDRDISTSEELQQYATAYDTLLGGGWDFGDDQPLIVARIAALASELYDNYVNPESAQSFALLHQNNHRAKTGAALVTAAVALAEYEPASGEDPRGVRDPADWLEYGLDQADLVMRYSLVTGDGAYAEGPFYFRYTSQNLLPFWRAWDRLVDGSDWLARGVVVPSHWRHPLLARGLRWTLDMTLPDGSLAPQDDGNPGRCYYFGAAPAGGEPAYGWRWQNCPTSYDTDGNISLAADAIVAYDDTLAPAPPQGPSTAFYVEGGNAIFRSDWSADAVVAILQAEHDTASEFGRDRDGMAVAPQSHEHPEPGAYMLYAYGERLALDPGYLSFTQKSLVDKPQDHNVILVDGAGPQNYLTASFDWLETPLGRNPADGHATLSDALDGERIDAARITTRYGQPAADSALIQRRALFLGDRYLLFADAVAAPVPRTYTWLLHGNGGGDSGGSFTTTAHGARWRRPRASLDTGIAFDVGPAAFDTVEGIHEEAGGARRTHTTLRASASGEAVRALQVVYPSQTVGDPAAPLIDPFAVAGGTGLRVYDASHGSHIAAAFRDADDELAILPPGIDRALHSDGRLAVIEADPEGRLRLAWAEEARQLAYDDGPRVDCETRGNLGLGIVAGGLEVIADCADPAVIVRGVDSAMGAADGACALEQSGDAVRLVLGRERRVVLRSDRDHSAPAADAGEPRRVTPPQVVRLAGSGCDADGDALSPRWELISAPAGSAWTLDAADAWTPELFVDRPGPYRVRLTVTDARGDVSRPVEVLIVGGEIGADGIDNDLDGRFDSDDPDGEAANQPPAALAESPAPLILVRAAETIELAALIGDADGDPIVYRAAAAGDAVQITIEGSRLTITPRQPGEAQVIVSAADRRGGRTFATVPVTVVDACTGDCGFDGAVTIDELTVGLRIALGVEPAAACSALDADGDRQVVVAELIAAVRRALEGCPEAGE